MTDRELLVMPSKKAVFVSHLLRGLPVMEPCEPRFSKKRTAWPAGNGSPSLQMESWRDWEPVLSLTGSQAIGKKSLASCYSLHLSSQRLEQHVDHFFRCCGCNFCCTFGHTGSARQRNFLLLNCSWLLLCRCGNARKSGVCIVFNLSHFSDL